MPAGALLAYTKVSGKYTWLESENIGQFLLVAASYPGGGSVIDVFSVGDE